ncbi:tRNA pseudouridine synthase B [Candidatus Blochmanniella vafra str. BVAF]|uniref:tRNA pseudouridine synthase B n=1 Tax=Blochmanniella vafra (strain BVAF) TaxID=859654 RepID=E8Q6S3_BLOVB|nr:tRNA pseudouridine(55) synthase TruB [Candidatus Blochmannia vafer]ADV33514.1 tRNA pseudouridine synthase B [Candidatus Blochmannia vafer str. BVAF]
MKRYLNLSKRQIHGILFLDKPSGFSCNFVLNKIKSFFYVKKIGYAGTLDPLATGMLPICFGKSTKFATYLSNSDKRYLVSAKLGESTDTFDSDGVIIRVSTVQCSEKKIENCLSSFVGKSYQIPPMFSAVKYHGVPLYKYARKGICVFRKPREIYVYSLSCINKIDNIIDLDIYCSKGTYIRSIIHDIGECLGCGAHVIRLRRLMISQYVPDFMIKIKTIEDIFYNTVLNDTEVLNNLDKLLVAQENLDRFK